MNNQPNTKEEWVKHFKSIFNKNQFKLNYSVPISESETREAVLSLKDLIRSGTIEEKYASTIVLAAIQSGQTAFMLSRGIIKEHVLQSPHLSESDKRKVKNTSLLDRVLALLKSETVEELYPSVKAKDKKSQLSSFCRITDTFTLSAMTVDKEREEELIKSYKAYRAKKEKSVLDNQTASRSKCRAIKSVGEKRKPDFKDVIEKYNLDDSRVS